MTPKEERMRVPHLSWDRRHNVAVLTVSFGRRIWHTREIGDFILGYNAAGRLARVVVLDPRRMLPPQATVGQALGHITQLLMRTDELRQAELDVLESALDRAAAIDYEARLYSSR
jgi:hypothetical protein